MADVVADVSGTIGSFEGMRFGNRVHRRLLGWRRFLPFAWLLLIVLLLVAWQVAALPLFADDRLNEIAYLALIAGLFISFPATHRRFLISVMRRKWQERGLTEQLEITYALTSEGLKIASPQRLILEYWRSLTEVARHREYWLIYGAGSVYFLPRRLFSSSAQERAFLSALLDRLDAPARQRSRAAAAFVATLPTAAG